MARRIVEAGHPLTLWARRAASLNPFADTAAVNAPSPAALAERCQVVCVCVTGDGDVEEVVLGPDGVLAGLAAGSTLVIHSTVDPETCVRLDAVARRQGVGLLDAPVSGGGPAAAAGSLLVMVGGDPGVLDRVRLVLATFGDPVLHLGPVGSGQTAKLVNNLVFTAQIALADDTFTLVDGLGLDRAAMARVLERGSGGSRGAAILAMSGFDLMALASAAGPLLAKDHRLVADVAARHRVGLPPGLRELAEAALAAWEGIGQPDL